MAPLSVPAPARLRQLLRSKSPFKAIGKPMIAPLPSRKTKISWALEGCVAFALQNGNLARLRTGCIVPNSPGAFCNPQVDRLVDRQSSETDPVQRKKLAWEIEKKLVEANPLLLSRYGLLAAAAEGADDHGQQHL